MISVGWASRLRGRLLLSCGQRLCGWIVEFCVGVVIQVLWFHVLFWGGWGGFRVCCFVGLVICLGWAVVLWDLFLGFVGLLVGGWVVWLVACGSVVCLGSTVLVGVVRFVV